MQDDTNRESKECENDENMLCPWECMYSPMHRKKLREEKELGQRCLGKEKIKEKKGGREKLDMRPRRPRRRLRPKIARPPVLVHKFQTRVLLELALRPAGQATVRPERDAAVPGRCVARVGG